MPNAYSMPIKKKKIELRHEMRVVLQNLDRRWLEAASRELCVHLNYLVEHLVGFEVRHILAWMPFFPGEPDLTSFITKQLGKRNVYLPRVLPEREMKFISLGEDWLAVMEEGALGIPQPTDSAGDLYRESDASATVVIVPGLVFDRLGNRLGRGGGYYDRFLARAGMGGAVKVAAGWSLQLADDLPVDSHDVRMDWVCHERGYQSVNPRDGFDADEE